MQKRKVQIGDFFSASLRENLLFADFAALREISPQFFVRARSMIRTARVGLKMPQTQKRAK